MRRTTEAAGQDLAARRAAGETFGPGRPFAWHADATGKTVAFLGADATSVPQQGPHGERAEGRMPYVATVFNPPPMPPEERSEESTAEPIEAPRDEAPCVEAPCVEAPCVEAPCIEPSRVEPSRIEPSCIEPSCIEASCIEASCIEAPCIEAPCIEAPCIEASCVEASRVEAPCIEASCTKPKSRGRSQADTPRRPRRRRRTADPLAPAAKSRARVWDRRTVAGLLSLPQIAAQLRRECQAVGVDRADVVVGLTDGGAGLENCLIDAVAGLAKDIVFVLDFYHVTEHLQEFANLLLPADEAARKRQVEDWCHALKRRGGESLLAELESLDLADARSAVVEGHRRLTGYLRNNRHRTDYPTYLARGWQIGSGRIESNCKTVVAQRLKQSGMRWREPGTTAPCQLRALDRSQPEAWNDHWSRTAPA